MTELSWSPFCIVMVAMLGFFGGAILVKSKTQLFQRYINSLNMEQRLLYINVLRERVGIFLVGIIIGLIVSGLMISRTAPSSSSNSACLVVGVTLAIASGYYLLVPKQHYMLRSMNNKIQVNDWLNIYTSFRYYTYWGAVIGVIVYLISSKFSN